MQNFGRLPIVAVIGASKADSKTMETANHVGAAVAGMGWHLLTGGGSGVMEAACQGFSQNRQKPEQLAIGILPTEDADFANKYVDIAIPTGMGWARNAIIARTARGLIAVGGCSGTLSEVAFAWQAGRPVAALSDSGGWSEKLAGQAIDNRRNDVVFAARTARDAVEFLKMHFDNR